MKTEGTGDDGMAEASEFDYVIVGGGSAGCVLANRLSENPNNRVCLLEAGPGDWHPFIHMPMGILMMMRSRLFNWAYETEPEPHLNNRRLFWPRGKTLGGSSSVNAMCYTRGHARDYDHWAELGNRGWSYRDLLPYFKQSENFETQDAETEFHGRGGGYNVTVLRHHNPLSDVFLKAAEQAGYPRNDDFNGPEQEGFGWYSVAQQDGRRCSNADAFLHPVEQRPNLTVITRARATRVLLENRRATGVEYRKGRFGGLRRVRAKREVILSGGAINSPQLLLLSGVGPRDELARHGIACRHELPGVGENLQDHLDVTLIYKEKGRHSLKLGLFFLLWRAPIELLRYLFRRQGAFTSNFAEVGGFAKSEPGEALPNLQFHFLPAVEEEHGRKLRNTILHHGFSLRICDLRPLSRGRIGLHSADPLADARIEANYLAEKRDLDNLVAAVRCGREIIAAPAFARHRGKEMQPGESVRSDDRIAEFVRATAETIYHPVGSCKMGHDDLAVVDDRLCVHGLTGLRVIDASIMPTLVGGNTNAPTTAIAEKGAAMILEDRSESAGGDRAAA